MAAFGLALLQLEADDEAMEEALEAMEEEELQEEEEQPRVNMLMHFTMTAGAATAAAADAPASRASKRRVVQRGANVHQPSHCHAVSCRDAIVRCVRWPAWHACRSVCAARCVRTDACISSGSGAARKSRQGPIDIVVHERRLQILAAPRPSLVAPPRRHSAWCRRAVGRF